MDIFNPRSLLKSFIELGFPPESISKATGISTDLFQLCQEKSEAKAPLFLFWPSYSHF